MTALLFCLACLLAGVSVPRSATADPFRFCDQVTLEYYNRFLHIRSPANNIGNEEANARQISCSSAYTLGPDLDLVVGWGAMAFDNSFNTQAFSLGVSFEAQYRPDVLGNFGVFAGLDAGFIYGYKGHLPARSLIGPWRAGAISKFGVLWDVPDSAVSAFVGARYVPARGGAGGGIFAPGFGITYRFD
ncbi:MAG: hypothetical protein HOY44_09060 [Maritimibacter sp.]|uniref:hypothetical protein n=1 Tax=Maritimibacter sp. TaxID=2003363 RepID=UPI001D87B95F|nr:hypothetical protein [Maritimibacter sp.]MBL6427660.1 hypothetical protein [Maritimibacter sp.]